MARGTGHQPRSFDAEERQLLAQLAAVVSELITVRHICLTHEKVSQHAQWQALQRMLAEEVQQLSVLVCYLLAHFGIKVPVPAGVLRPVARRLDDLHLLLQKHHPGPIWYLPTAVA